MTTPPIDLAVRQAALEAAGFTIVEFIPQGFIAVRMRFHVLWGVRMVALVRVQQVGHVDRNLCVRGQTELRRLIAKHNPSKIPRGLGVFWSLLDVFLTDSTDPEALRYSKSKVGKGFGWSALTSIVTPDGPQPWARPIWGAAYQPVTNQIMEIASHGESRPDPMSWMAIVLGITTFWPGWVIIILSCCGIPLLPLIGLVMSENGPRPALEDSPEASAT
jgi:hypothetical protein